MTTQVAQVKKPASTGQLSAGRIQVLRSGLRAKILRIKDGGPCTVDTIDIMDSKGKKPPYFSTACVKL